MPEMTQNSGDFPGGHRMAGDSPGGHRAEGDAAVGHHRAHGGSRAHNPARPRAQAGGDLASTGLEGAPPPVSPTVPLEVRPAQRIWLQEEGVRLFGPGTNELLRRVDATGSLNKAAKDMAMSYSKAWRIVHEVEQRLGIELFERQTGGTGGGGSCLTDEGRQLLLRFDAFSQAADEALAELFETHFGDLFPGAPDAELGEPSRTVGPSAE